MSKILDPELEKKIDIIAEGIFGSQQDPDQIPITTEPGAKLDSLTSHWIKYRLDEKGDPIAWVIAIPTSKELCQKFVDKEITEKQLLDLAVPQEHYSAIYLCAAVVLPEYRRKGLTLELFKEAVENISKTEGYILFAWPTGEGGLEVARKVGRFFDREVLIRK